MIMEWLKGVLVVLLNSMGEINANELRPTAGE